MTDNIVQTYILIRDLVIEQYGKEFFLKKGAVLKYFAHTDVYLFDGQDGYVPSLRRSIVERIPDYFKPEGAQ